MVGDAIVDERKLMIEAVGKASKLVGTATSELRGLISEFSVPEAPAFFGLAFSSTTHVADGVLYVGDLLLPIFNLVGDRWYLCRPAPLLQFLANSANYYLPIYSSFHYLLRR